MSAISRVVLGRGFSAAIILAATGAWGQTAVAQTYVPYGNAPVYSSPPVVAQTAVADRLMDEQIDQLMMSIALYPDPLLAQILPAATYPLEVVTAARFVRAYPQATDADFARQNWDPSVMALAHYPSVLQTMSDNLEWTQTLGAAFVNQQADVMASIQRLRVQAQASGALLNTQQQEVLAAEDGIRIVPVNPLVLYVPVYDPQVIFVQRPWIGHPRVAVTSFISFGSGFAIGVWLNNDIDWHDHWVAVGGGWHRDWRYEGNRVVFERDVRARERERTRDVHVERVVVRPWAHDPVKAAPRLPATMIRHDDDRRGWPAQTGVTVQVHGGQVTGSVQVNTPELHVFGGYENRADVQHEVERGRASRPNVHESPHAPPPVPVQVVPQNGPQKMGHQDRDRHGH